MGLYKVKNLYINGCSFTYGDSLPKEQTWPELLSKKLNLNLLNHSVNGNSMQSITFNSVNYLSKLKPLNLYGKSKHLFDLHISNKIKNEG